MATRWCVVCGGDLRYPRSLPRPSDERRRSGAGIRLIDNTFVNCGTAVRLEGNSHAFIDGMTLIDTRIGIDIASPNATVEVRNATQRFTRQDR